MINRNGVSIILFCATLVLLAGAPCLASEGAVVSAAGLFEAARKDVEGTARKYADGPVTVRGIAVSVGPDIHNLPSVGLSDRAGGTVYVHCVLPDGDFSKLEGVKAGQEVMLRGNYLLFSTGEVFGNDEMVVLKQCEITGARSPDMKRYRPHG